MLGMRVQLDTRRLRRLRRRKWRRNTRLCNTRRRTRNDHSTIGIAARVRRRFGCCDGDSEQRASEEGQAHKQEHQKVNKVGVVAHLRHADQMQIAAFITIASSENVPTATVLAVGSNASTMTSTSMRNAYATPAENKVTAVASEFPSLMLGGHLLLQQP